MSLVKNISRNSFTSRGAFKTSSPWGETIEETYMVKYNFFVIHIFFSIKKTYYFTNNLLLYKFSENNIINCNNQETFLAASVLDAAFVTLVVGRIS